MTLENSEKDSLGEEVHIPRSLKLPTVVFSRAESI